MRMHLGVALAGVADEDDCCGTRLEQRADDGLLIVAQGVRPNVAQVEAKRREVVLEEEAPACGARTAPESR